MKLLYTTCSALLLTSILSFGQTNLNLTSTATASASSSGSYGPSNWNDGIINGAFFGWVGTGLAQPSPSFMEFSWSSPQTFDSIVIVNLSTNFAPPAGNGVVFSGTADLEYYDGNQWILISNFSGQGSFGFSYSLTFAPVTGTKFRINNINTGANPASSNPGFDEIEVYLTPQTPSIFDAELVTVDTTLITQDQELQIRATASNLGNQILDTIQFFYNVSGNASIIQEDFALNLAPGSDTTIAFNTRLDLINLPSPLYMEDLCVWVVHDSDIQNANDTICVSLLPLSSTENEILEIPSVFPNPSNNYWLIKSQSGIQRVRIFDLRGSKVATYNGASKHEIRIDHQLPNGLYTLEVQTSKGYHRQRVIIEK